MGIRRMVDTNKGNVSFRRLLEEVARNASLLTRAWFCSDVPVIVADTFHRGFTDLAGPGATLNPAVPRRDRDDLVAAAAAVKTFVDEHLAHTSLSPTTPPPDMTTIDAAVDLLADLLRKYLRLIDRADRDPVTPIIQIPWTRVFNQPWSS
jgi:hypothetical protein